MHWIEDLRKYIREQSQLIHIKTRSRPNRRFGFNAPGYKTKRGTAIFVAIDLSLNLIPDTVREIYKAIEGIDPLHEMENTIFIVPFQDKVYTPRHFPRPGVVPVAMPTGSGMTDYDCVLDNIINVGYGQVDANLGRAIIIISGKVGVLKKIKPREPLFWLLTDSEFNSINPVIMKY